VDGTEGLSLADTIPDAHSPDPLRVAEAVETVVALGQAIDALPERERLMVSLYYNDGLTMKEISQVLDVSESRVSQIHTQAVAHLRVLMKGTGKKECRVA
ncbi:MAG: sigma-70 family RNA polymerase sigma factor, partial [Chloroflexota bacterium]